MAEKQVWSDWQGPRISPKLILGDGLCAAAAWQCVLAIQRLRQKRESAAIVSVVGCNQQAIGAYFTQTWSVWWGMAGSYPSNQVSQ